MTKLDEALEAGRYILHAKSGNYPMSGSDIELSDKHIDGSKEKR